ncbi:OLC1v1019275C1 [Oldenlandia corymbosa var. corymbosa]|uniref:OLC1v1019275C1 n=1 Tax=Oldenlandia corymbosa var. corymbosa TaxID=529605 RepID=A0AAV1EDP5_OLDCO|nr:OLC1v1019275C1 [Oldenlandia corymbosa var. corymbosa]
MEDSSGDLLMEERDELMVPFAHTDEDPTFRTAHFLKPTLGSIQTHSAAFPLLSNISSPESDRRSKNVIFPGWRGTQEGWEEWVDELSPLYGDTWKKAGIFDAILASTYQPRRTKFQTQFIMKLVEKWCPETNTFMFSWGEATITLEDIMVLGGFPVLGQLVLTPVESEEMLALEEQLRKIHTRISHEKGQCARESAWLEHFKGGEDKTLEHEAFLVLWLSRYVFPGNHNIIAKDLFLIAINLSRGILIALGPAVLASIYSDLGLFKKFLQPLSNLGTGECASKNTQLSLCSPLRLVQIWAWERFPTLCPKPNLILLGKTRSARWFEVNKWVAPNDIQKALDSAKDDFLWRPYAPTLTNWNPKKLYQEHEQYIIVTPNIDSEVETLVRCWRTSELVGFDCKEQYLPHRVGMQFGFDQDVPGFVERWNGHTDEFAWNHYNRPIRDEKLYIPARLFEADVTQRYLELWRAHQLKLRNGIGAGNDALPHDVMQQASADVLKDDDMIAEKQSDVESLSSSQKNNIPTLVNNKLFPLQKDDPIVEKQAGKDIPSSSVENDDENAEAVPEKEENTNGDDPKLTQEIHETFGTFAAGKEESLTEVAEICGENGKKFPNRLVMLRNELEIRNIRIGRLEKIVGQLKKEKCKNSILEDQRK